MYKNYFYFIIILFFLASCGGNDNATTPLNYTKFEVKIAPKIGSNALELGKYFALSSDDSLMVSRLDFYMTNLTFFDTISNASGIYPLYLFSQDSKDSLTFVDSARVLKNLNKIKFISGLTDASNNSNPTSFALNHPLSSSKGMYWNEWTKYRYIIFEGEIKKKTGDKIAFSYHTGLTFKREILLNKSIMITQGTTNNIQFNLALDKVFYPTNSSNILDVFNGENFGHSDTNDAMITNKFLNNFSMAFGI